MTIETILQQLVVLYTALITLLGGVPVDMANLATTTPPAVIEEVTFEPREVKVYSRPVVGEGEGTSSFVPTVTTYSAPKNDAEGFPMVGGEITNEVIIPSIQMAEVTYNIVPQEGSPLEARSNLSLEQLREYVLSTNPNIVAFRKKVAVAPAEELINILVQNGFTVVEN